MSEGKGGRSAAPDEVDYSPTKEQFDRIAAHTVSEVMREAERLRREQERPGVVNDALAKLARIAADHEARVAALEARLG